MPIDQLRTGIAMRVRELVAGTSEPTVRAFDVDVPGLMAADSPVRRVHADPSMFVGGVRSLLLQTLHPPTMRGVAEHSDYRHDPLGRLHRTAQFLGATTYGSVDDGTQAINIVRSIHSRVRGAMPDGQAYSADDPDNLAWVHITEVDSFLRGYQRYGSEPLQPAECDRYVADMAPIGEALGMVDAPRNQAELDRLLRSYRSELAATDDCREATKFLFAPPLPRSALPFYSLIFAASVGLLPRWARSMLLLPVPPGVDAFLLRPATTALTSTLRWAMSATAT